MSRRIQKFSTRLSRWKREQHKLAVEWGVVTEIPDSVKKMFKIYRETFRFQSKINRKFYGCHYYTHWKICEFLSWPKELRRDSMEIVCLKVIRRNFYGATNHLILLCLLRHLSLILVRIRKKNISIPQQRKERKLHAHNIPKRDERE